MKSRSCLNRNKNKPNSRNPKNNFYKLKSVKLSRLTPIYKTNSTDTTTTIEDWKTIMRNYKSNMRIWKKGLMKQRQMQKRYSKSWNSSYKGWRDTFSSLIYRLKRSYRSNYRQKTSRYRICKGFTGISCKRYRTREHNKCYWKTNSSKI